MVEELSECFRDLVKEVKDLVRSSRDPSPTRQTDHHSPRAITTHHPQASMQPQTIIHHVPHYQQSQLQAPQTVVQPIISPPIMPYHMGHPMGHHPMGPQVAPMAPPYNYSTYPGPAYHHAFQYAQAPPAAQIMTKGSHRKAIQVETDTVIESTESINRLVRSESRRRLPDPPSGVEPVTLQSQFHSANESIQLEQRMQGE